MITLKIPKLSSYNICPKLGFLSPAKPLTIFPSAYYAPWDELIIQLPSLVSSKALGEQIRRLPLLSTPKLTTERELQRAYVVLAFLVHAYVWHVNPPNEVTPPQLSEPFLDVRQKVGMEPVVSYAGLCLWNYRCKGVSEGMDLEEMESLASFTGARGEDAFYQVPVLIEAEGGFLVQLLLDAIVKAQQGNTQFVIEALEQSASAFVRMGEHLPKLYSLLDAGFFYHQLRPFIAGGKGMEEKGLPRGMVFKKKDGSEVPMKCVGGSAIQSSLFHFLDYALGVKHKPAEVGAPEPIFMEMRACMPGKHRAFLELVSGLPSIRVFVEANPSDTNLGQAFDNAIKHFRIWRSKHIAIVSKYIVQPARLAEKGHPNSTVERLEVNGSDQADDWELQGTGGSALIPFLKQARDETIGVEVHSAANGL